MLLLLTVCVLSQAKWNLFPEKGILGTSADVETVHSGAKPPL